MPGRGRERQIRLLVVDDDDAFRATMVRVLGAAGYECDEAANADDARRRLEDSDIAAVLCDIRMPGTSGIELLRWIAADFPAIAVVMTTGIDEPATAQLAFEIGAYGYLVKPFTRNEVLIALAGAMQRQELEVVRAAEMRALQRRLERLRMLRNVVVDIERTGPTDADAETMERLARAVSLRDEETGAHIERMSRYAAVLSDTLGLPHHTRDEIRLAAALHDVGKIGVPDTILLKPSALTPDEYVVMQRHSQIGYQLLAESDSHLLALAAKVALEHHEWWDGSGYPHGRHEEEISPEARVAAVADVFDALTSHRVYRAAMSVDDAVAVMTELRGRQFEPRALDGFLDSLAEFAAIRAEHPEQEDAGRIRILIVDDHEIFVQSLVRVLGGQPDMRIVGTAGTVAEAARAAAAYEPDVVLMDFELPDGDGAHATRLIHTLLPAVQVVLLTGRADRDAVIRAIAAGCAGFVNKTESIDTLAAAIRDAANGDAPMSIADLPRLLTHLRPTKRGIGDDLGDRQLEVLRLMAAGLPNKLIAARLHISVNTVRNHVQNILGKLDAHSKLEAVATAVREGILERDSGISTG